jgi:hypothetical protein
MYIHTIPMKTADTFENLTPIYGTRRFHSQNYGNIKNNLDVFIIIIKLLSKHDYHVHEQYNLFCHLEISHCSTKSYSLLFEIAYLKRIIN